MDITKKKRIVTFLMLLLVSVWMFDGTVHATSSYSKKVTKKNEKFNVEAEYGMGGLVYYDMPAMVSITVECKENFSGTLQLIPGGENYGTSVVAYGEDISLSAGEAKTFYFVPTSIGSNGKIIIQIENEKGKVVYRETNEIMLESGGSKVSIGILSDDYSALSYFDGIGMTVDSSQAITTIFELNKDTFPEDALGLAMLQYMVIDNFDTASFSDKQYEALKSWVQDGGVLILGLGSNYQNVLHCFDDEFLTGTLGTLGKTNVMWETLEHTAFISTVGSEVSTEETAETSTTEVTVEEKSVENGEESLVNEEQEKAASMKLDCIEFQLEGGEPFSEYTTAGSAYTKEVGFGRVVVLGYSMGMEPMASSPYKQSIAKFTLENAQMESTTSRFYGNDASRDALYSGVEVAKLADSSKRPSVLLYGFILFVYVALVGPILYVVLKAMNKREKIWVAIPIVTLAFTVIIYLTGFMYRMNKPLVSTFTVVQLQENARSEKIYTNIVCPKPKEYAIQFTEEYTGFKKNLNDYSYNMFETTTDEISYDYMLKKNGTGTEMLLNCTEPFQQTSVSISHTGDNNIGTIDSNLKCYTTGFEGTVTNNTCYDLHDVVVTFENYICLVGDVKKGETMTIDSSKIVMAKAYGTFESFYPAQRLYSDREIYLSYQINSMVENNAIDKSAHQKGYIWASIPSYQPELVDGSDVKRAGCGVLLTSFTAEYEDVTGEYYQSIDELAIASQGDFDSLDRSIYSTEVVITYSFEDCSGITTLENMEDTGNAYNGHGTPADVYAYNVEKGDYEPIFTDGNILSGQELKKYMLDDVIVLKYMQASSGYGAYIPRISARGE